MQREQWSLFLQATGTLPSIFFNAFLLTRSSWHFLDLIIINFGNQIITVFLIWGGTVFGILC